MSDFNAIGAVSTTLQTLLLDRMELPDWVSAAPVTIGLPAFSSLDHDPHREDARINLFLYRVTENGYLQNQEIPGRGAAGAYGHPPLSLNLHYLVTAYGTTVVNGTAGTATFFDDTTAQALLGSAMRVFHDVPIITDTLTTLRPPSGSLVLAGNLRDDFEHIKLSLEPLTLEDITKIWTALTLRYRLSASYVVNVVQIESHRPRRFPRPVGQPASPTVPPLPTDPPAPGPMVYGLLIQTPTITDVRVRRVGEVAEQPFPYAKVGDTLVLRGTSLSGPNTNVQIGEVVVAASLANADRVEAVIPDATIPGVGPIPAALELQPGVRTVKIIVSDPLVPQRAFSSNEAVFMLVPGVNPTTLAYSAGPPRTLTLQGSRLVSAAPGGETVIGRSVVARTAYRTASPTQIVVPIPDTLPTRGVHAIIGAALPDPVPLGAGAQTLTITVGASSKTITANLSPSIARGAVAAILAGLIHDANPTDAGFTGTRVDLWHDQLVVVPGGLTDPIAISSPPGLTFASDLGLAVAPPPGAGSALVSGSLTSPPPLSAPSPRVTLTIGTQPSITVPIARTTSLAALADDLQSRINATGGPAEYTNALVATTASQMLVVPGAAGAVSFTAAPGDATTVAELQLHAHFAVRVRVNGAESIDKAVVELPQ